jgi:hypothetical protein
VSGEPNASLPRALIELGARPVRWLLDLGRARRLRRLRRAPVRMIDRKILLRLAGGTR